MIQNFSGLVTFIEATSPHFLQNVKISGEPKEKVLPMGRRFESPLLISPLVNVVLPHDLQTKFASFIRITSDSVYDTSN